MIEEQLAARFRAALADEPPLGFDPDDLADRAARNDHRRAAVLGASVAAVTVVLVAATVLQVVRAGDGQPSAIGSAPTTKTRPTDPCLTDLTDINSKPPKSCDFDAKGMAMLEDIAPKVLADHLPGVPLLNIGWKPLGERRCVTGAYQLNGDGYQAISFTVCHDQKEGLDLTPVPGDWGEVTGESVNPDGSRTVVYRSEYEGAGGLSVEHHRLDGVVVQAGTGFKASHGQHGPVVSEEQLTAIVSDPRLAF